MKLVNRKQSNNMGVKIPQNDESTLSCFVIFKIPILISLASSYIQHQQKTSPLLSPLSDTHT